MVKRFNKTLIHQMALFIATCQDDWEEHLPYLLKAYQTSQQGATANSLVLLMYGWEIRSPVKLLCGPMPEHDDGPPGENYACYLEVGMEQVHAFTCRQLHLVGMRMKHRYGHWSQASKYSPERMICFFNPQRRKGQWPKLTSP